jgi:LmbE family N-acetylglucosaminyl deacetylase
MNLTLLVVFAHPDDESFGPAATLAKYVAEGVRITLVCATRGEVGEISDPQLATPETLGEVREEELRCACRALGIEDLRFLGFRDGRLAEVDPQEAGAKIVKTMREAAPQVVITWGPEGGYGHLDHVAISRFTTSAFDAFLEGKGREKGPHDRAKLYYTAFPKSQIDILRSHLGGLKIELSEEELEFTGVDERLITTVIDVRPYVDQKITALFCHRTQFGPQSFMVKMPQKPLREFMGREYFRLARSKVLPLEGMESDLFSGSS